MKYKMSLKAVFTLLVIMLSANSYAYHLKYQNADGVWIYYNVEDTDQGRELTVVNPSDDPNGGYSGVVNIPAEVEGRNGVMMKVVAIGDYAFNCCYELTSVSIPEGVRSIGAHAFQFSNRMTSVRIPASVTTIGTQAFQYCGLLAVSIPANVTKIGSECFVGNYDMAYIYSYIQEPFNVSSLMDSWNFETTILYVPVGTVDKYKARNGWKKFQNIRENKIFTAVNADGVSLNYEPVSNGTALMMVSGAVSGITYAGAVNIPAEVSYNGTTLKVTSLSGDAFTNCDQLTSVTIPATVTSVGDIPFEGCGGLTTIKVAEDNPVYDSRDNCNALIETAHNGLLRGCQNTVIPEGIAWINNFAFNKCAKLKAIDIPSSVTSIDPCAFQDCTGLTSITLPSGLYDLGYHAFAGVDLKSVTSLMEDPPLIDGIQPNAWESGTFSDNTYLEGTLYVPLGTADKYKKTEGWSDFKHVEEFDASGLRRVEASSPTAPYYDLNGVRITQPRKGIYIQKGKKVMVKD